MASTRCEGSLSKSPLATRPASSTAPSRPQVGVVDRSRACRIRRPWPPAAANCVRTELSQDNHNSLATNSWQRSRCTSTASCERPPRLRKAEMMTSSRSASRATMTLSATLASSSAASSRSTRASRCATTSDSRSRERAVSDDASAPPNSWHKVVRPACCCTQCPPAGSPCRSSRRPSASNSTTAGCPSRKTSSLYFGSTSFPSVRKVLARERGTETKRVAMTVGLGRSKNFQRWRDFSRSTSGLASIDCSIFSSSPLRDLMTATSVPSTPFGGIGGSRTPGHSVSNDRCRASKSP
mmetsp:Transcript_75941/g.217466  ORF Transcript_75941/g.217466 Transcript_75941/m.217466 type:complete len:296 (+) Transcript_75941:346-1233(+)